MSRVSSTIQEEETLMENTYCQVYGTLKSYHGNKQLLALHMEPVTDFNWITAHLMDVMYTALQLSRLKEEIFYPFSLDRNFTDLSHNIRQ
ncbi:hypothetical protein E2C01_004916 [Portunus trituberculatus]|uniref:Uncharacterized protein n=1 Tax=Portunus trituberculatus TaxID=210409 RepID=A0A5B7CSW9_PORTR|nr:hypothetical protein [Portunus trituberculatus]